MHRTLIRSAAGLLLPCFLGCQAIQESQNLVPLPENAPPQPYRDLVVRARFQASAANESFYANKWTELEETAKVLGQTAGMVTKATGVPAAREKESPSPAANWRRRPARCAAWRPPETRRA